MVSGIGSRVIDHQSYVCRHIEESGAEWTCSMLKPGVSTCRSSAADWGNIVRRNELLTDLLRRALPLELRVMRCSISSLKHVSSQLSPPP